MTMFSAACYQFVRSVGKNTLHPTPTIDQKDDIKPLQLVIKSTKRKYFFFQKSVYRPTDFQITDVLTKKSPLKVVEEEATELSNYNRKTELSLKGKFGADLAAEIIDIDLEADDKITVNIDFGRVMKKEVKIPELMEQLNRRFVNLTHDYIEQIRADRRNVLCVITGVAYLDKGGTIHRETKMDANASLSTKLLKEINPDAGAEYDKGKDLGLAPGMPVAYCVKELNVDKKSGGIEMVLTDCKSGGFKEGISYDEVDHAEKKEIDFQSPVKCFEPLLSLPEKQRKEITLDLLCILETPCDLPALANMFEKFESKSQDADGEVLKLKAPSTVVERVLGLAGIMLHDDKACPPKSETTMLPCLSEFFDAAAELDDEVLFLIVGCSQDIAKLLLTVLQEGIKGAAVTDKEIIEKLTKDSESSHRKLLDELRFVFTDNEIKAPIELPYYIDEIYWVLTALWG